MTHEQHRASNQNGTDTHANLSEWDIIVIVINYNLI